MPKQKTYACSLQATFYMHSSHAAYVVESTSKAAAAEIAMQEALRLWPVAREWKHHSVKVVLVKPA